MVQKYLCLIFTNSKKTLEKTADKINTVEFDNTTIVSTDIVGKLLNDNSILVKLYGEETLLAQLIDYSIFSDDGYTIGTNSAVVGANSGISTWTIALGVLGVAVVVSNSSSSHSDPDSTPMINTITITSICSGSTGTRPHTITFDFSDDIATFNETDIMVKNGSLIANSLTKVTNS